MERPDQLTQVLVTLQKLPAEKRHLAAEEWPEQLTQEMATV